MHWRKTWAHGGSTQKPKANSCTTKQLTKKSGGQGGCQFVGCRRQQKKNSGSRFFMHSNNEHLKHFLLKNICSQGEGGVVPLLICWSATKDSMFSFSSATKDALQKFTLLSRVKVCISYHRHSLRIFFQVLISSND
jgi:hypothetical protein